MTRRSWFLAFLVALGGSGGIASPTVAQEPESGALRFDLPAVMVTGVEYDVTIVVPSEQTATESTYVISDVDTGDVILRGTLPALEEEGALRREVTISGLVVDRTDVREIQLSLGRSTATREVQVLPAWLSILPPLLAILLALVFRQVLVALVSGVWLGALFMNGFDPLAALLRTIDTYVVGRLADADNASVIVFSMTLGGMIGVVTRSGGGKGLVDVVTRFARSSRSGQASVWTMGLLIFFDDYANSLLVGTSMRPISDRLRMSREKLAFLIDATAAPVASLALVSSWIGVEVGHIDAQFRAEGLEHNAYWAFIESLPYRFYPILMLCFGFFLIVMRRDFGSMWKAEKRARSTGEVLRPGSKPASELDADPAEIEIRPRWENAIVPVLAVVVTAIVAMYVTGRQAFPVDADPSLREIFGEANSYAALLWAALLGSVVAILMSLLRRSLTLAAAVDAWVAGARSMVLACIILILAWALGYVCRHELYTANFVIASIGSWLSPAILPAVVFFVAAAISFATGTSYGTMAILFPLVIPLAHGLVPGDYMLLISAISSILAGSVWGDHCSPLSDTTILSSMAASCDHIDHVRTQLPYALVVGVVSVLIGELGTGFGLYPAWVALLLAGAVLFAIVRFFGKPVDDYRP